MSPTAPRHQNNGFLPVMDLYDDTNEVLLNNCVKGSVNGALLFELFSRDDGLVCRRDVEGIVLSFVQCALHFPPFLMKNGICFAKICCEDVYLIVSALGNANIACMFSFLCALKKVLMFYLKDLCEESIRDNYLFLHELIPEMMDFGYIQLTDIALLDRVISMERHQKEINSDSDSLLTPTASHSTIHSPPIRYRKNELFIDIIEKITFLANSDGAIVYGRVDGVITMKPLLSNFPLIKAKMFDHIIFRELDNRNTLLGNGVIIEDFNIPDAVKFKDGEFCVTPNDTSFQLVNYHLTLKELPVQVQFSVNLNVERKLIEYDISVCVNISALNSVQDFKLRGFVPAVTCSFDTMCDKGKVAFLLERNEFVWTCLSLHTGQYQIKIQFEFCSDELDNEMVFKRQPLQLEYSLPSYLTSGMGFLYIQVINPGDDYQTTKYTRSETQVISGEVRFPTSSIRTVT